MGARSRAGWVVVGAAGLIAIVAMTSRSGLVVPALALPDRSSFLKLAEVVGYVAIGVGVFAVPVVIAVYRRRWRTANREEREYPLYALPWWLRLLGLATVLVVVAGQAAIVATFLHELQAAWVATDTTADPGSGPRDPAMREGGADLTALIVAAVILVAIALIVVVIAIRWLTLDRPAGPTPAARVAATREALEVSLDALRREPDPRRAVIVAYGAMERCLAKAGFGRRRSEAPLEYLRRVLDVSGLADDHLRTITLLFQDARFSTHPIQESMRTRAIDALGGLRATVGERA